MLFKHQFGTKGKTLRSVSVDDGYAALEKAVSTIVREARWHPYRTKINSLRKPLLELRLAKRRAGQGVSS